MVNDICNGGGSLAQRVVIRLHAMHAAKTAQTAAPTWQADGASFSLFQSSAEVDSYYQTYHMSRKRPNPGLLTAVDAAASFPAATGAAGASADGD